MSCGKVRLFDVGAEFVQADITWFEGEETLFVFYQVNALQGLNQLSAVEISWDGPEPRDWTPIEDLPKVHTHIPADCGVTSLCGSTSLHVPGEPTRVRLRLRYHPDAESNVSAQPLYNVVGDGPPPASRSFLVYGIFDERNVLIQWRGRHQFPTIRNQRAERLGLRRDFTVRDQRYGIVGTAPSNNPYGYGEPCPDGFTATDIPELTSNRRAVFNLEELPQASFGASAVCAEVSVRDATGSYTTDAYARKNPEIRSAFPRYENPVREATVLPFFLAPCGRIISTEHEEMQRQRLQMPGVPVTCTDDALSPAFTFQLAVAFLDAIETARPAGNDMVLAIGIHQDDDAVSAAVEEALATFLPEERHRTSPRVAGAFVFDSEARRITMEGVDKTTLWCPSLIGNAGFSASAVSCPKLPDDPALLLGPIAIDTLPILPDREEYLDFIDDFSVRLAGTINELTYRVPEFTPTTDHRDLGDFGVVTFANGEAITADGDDAFSYCATKEPLPFVVRSALMESPQLAYLLADYCVSTTPTPGDSGRGGGEDTEPQPVGGPTPGVGPDDYTGYGKGSSICDAILAGLLPIDALPDWHSVFGESRYEIGLFWEFPFLLQLEYEARTAASVTAFGVTIPFGFGSEDQSFFGSRLWRDREEIPKKKKAFKPDPYDIDSILQHCRRFCDHPTLDGAGVYNVLAPFRATYARACYRPRFPDPNDENFDGFPLDP